MKIPTLFVLVALAIATTACFAGDSMVEQAVRDADDQWSKAATMKDVDKTVSFYSSDATVLPPNSPAVTTKEEIYKLWKNFLDSLSAISWKTTRVEAATSGDLAFLSGTYEMTGKDGTKDRGKYLEVFKKQGDGSWKCTADMFSSDLPPKGTPAEKK